MKISANNWSVKSLEKTYQQVSPKVQKTQRSEASSSLPGLKAFKGLKKVKAMLPQDILSSEEKLTLKRLFEFDTSFNFYGKANRQKALSGMLLDVTG